VQRRILAFPRPEELLLLHGVAAVPMGAPGGMTRPGACGSAWPARRTLAWRLMLTPAGGDGRGAKRPSGTGRGSGQKGPHQHRMGRAWRPDAPRRGSR
jgi:hypothetical protein